MPGREDYRPLSGRAKWAVLALVAVLAVDGIALAFGLVERSLVQQVRDGDDVSLAKLDASDRRQQVIGIVQLAVYVITAVLFLRWFHLAYRNLVPLGVPEPRYRTSAAVWSWFVPILGLFRPKQIANDIWRATDPGEGPTRGIEWRERPLPWFYLPWWALFLISGTVYNHAFRTSLNEPAIFELDDVFDHTLGVNRAYLIADALSICAGLFAILVVVRVTKRQNALAARG